jgi:hypothetical protein
LDCDADLDFDADLVFGADLDLELAFAFGGAQVLRCLAEEVVVANPPQQRGAITQLSSAQS